MIDIFDIFITVFYIEVAPGWVYILCVENPAVMTQRSLSHHHADRVLLHSVLSFSRYGFMGTRLQSIFLKKVLPPISLRKYLAKDGSVFPAPQGVLLLLSKVTQKHFRQQSHQKCFALSEGMPHSASAVDRFRFFQGQKGQFR